MQGDPRNNFATTFLFRGLRNDEQFRFGLINFFNEALFA
jgi:hypothetical protein